MKAMILCAGEGNRMRPLTNTTPKPLLKVGNSSLVEHHLKKLKKNGFKDVVINIAYLGYKIPKALGDGEKWDLNISYSDEQKEGGLETAGGIVKALPLLGNDTFLVVNGDIFSDYEFDKNMELKEGILAHFILIENPSHNPNGDFGIDKGNLTNNKKYTFTGIGYYSSEFFKDIPCEKLALAPFIREAIKNKKVTGELYKGKWLDIGTPKRLEDLNIELLNNKNIK